VLCGLLLATGATAAELNRLDVSKRDGRIFVQAELTIEGRRDRVYDALIDFNSFDKWSQRFKYSSYIEDAPDGRRRARNDIEGCILFFCRTVKRVLVLDIDKPAYLRATAEPELSDVDYGREEWWLTETEASTDAKEATRIVYEHEVKFGFWVPPVIGVWAIKRALRRDSLNAAQRLEDMVY